MGTGHQQTGLVNNAKLMLRELTNPVFHRFATAGAAVAGELLSGAADHDCHAQRPHCVCSGGSITVAERRLSSCQHAGGSMTIASSGRSVPTRESARLPD